VGSWVQDDGVAMRAYDLRDSHDRGWTVGFGGKCFRGVMVVTERDDLSETNAHCSCDSRKRWPSLEDRSLIIHPGSFIQNNTLETNKGMNL
jgi:hypothetical protein